MAVVEQHREGRIAWLTIDAPPCNVMTREVFVALLQASESLSTEPDITVVVLQSADPDFFIAHFDVELLLATPLGRPAVRGDELNAFDTMCERFRTMDKVTIAKIAGRVGGGGAELSLACDMRYGALERAVVNQMEVPIGIIPGGGATQRLPGRVGWGRAMEIIAAGVDLDAATGERWGWFDRALPADELDSFVDGLARRIASFPPDAVRHAKAAMLAGVPDPTNGLLTESYHFDQTMADPSTRETMQRFLDLGGQTRAGEMIVDRTAARAAIEPS